MDNVLDVEIETYQKHKNKLLESDLGRYVLVKGDEIVGIFDTKRDAIQQGYKELGKTPFLVEKIAYIEPRAHFTSNW